MFCSLKNKPFKPYWVYFFRWSASKCVNRSEFRANWQVSCSKAYLGIVWIRIGGPPFAPFAGLRSPRHWLQAQKKMSCIICLYFFRFHSLFLLVPPICLCSSFLQRPGWPREPRSIRWVITSPSPSHTPYSTV